MRKSFGRSITTIGVTATLAMVVHSVPASAKPKKKNKTTKPPVTAPAADPQPAPPPTDEPKPAMAADAPTTAPVAVPTATPPPTAAGSAAATPPPDVQADSAISSVDQLRQEYLGLRDELFASRARAAAVSSQLFSTKVVIRFRFDAGRYYSVPKASVRLDGASVFEDTQGAIAADDAVRFTGFVAPGHHVLSFRVETIGKDDDRFSSANEAQVSVEAVAGKDLLVTARAKDAGDIPYAWKRSEHGDYGLSMSINVKTEKNATAVVNKDGRATK